MLHNMARTASTSSCPSPPHSGAGTLYLPRGKLAPFPPWGAEGCVRWCLALCLFISAPAAAEPADTALVLAVDVSLSVNDDRYTLQRDGIATALEAPETTVAIQSGPHHAIELAVMEFSDPDRQFVTIPWIRIASAEDAAAVAKRIRATHRTSHGLTGLADALRVAAAMLHDLPDPADRRIVDLSSDGMSNIGVPMAQARDAAIAGGITINGLPILTEEPWLETYYAEYVIGGPDAFVEVAETEADFLTALQKKLQRELLISRAEIISPIRE